MHKVKPWPNGDDDDDEVHDYGQDEADRLVDGNEFGERAHE